MTQKVTSQVLTSALFQVPPANLPLLELLNQFLMTDGNPEWLLEQAPTIQSVRTASLKTIELAKEVNKQCLSLKPVASPGIPLGF
jgi:hypothetical protein